MAEKERTESDEQMIRDLWAIRNLGKSKATGSLHYTNGWALFGYVLLL